MKVTRVILSVDDVKRLIQERVRKQHKRNRLLKKLSNYSSCEINIQGNFTVARLKRRGRNASAIGVAKRNPIDKVDVERGIVISVCRALRNM